MQTLQQSVVQFPRDSSAFVNPRFHAYRELPSQLKNTKPIDGPQQERKRSRAYRAKPASLIPGGGDSEIDRRSALIPYAVIVACDYAKAIRAWGQVGVKRLAANPGFLPRRLL